MEKEKEDIISKEIDKIKKKNIITKNLLKKRKDFRDVLTFTIDPEKSLDFDDAISFKSLDGGLYEIGIHIADVTYFIKKSNTIDKNARNLSMSLYSFDRCDRPMLPKVLCEDICSLRQDKDKLTFSVVFIMDADANIKDIWFGKTIINTDKNFTYQQAQDIIDGDNDNIFSEALKSLNTLAKKLKKKRIKSGAIDIDRPELNYTLDNKKRIIDIKKANHLNSNDLIEEFMIITNNAVASKLHNDDYPAVYRNHDETINTNYLNNKIMYFNVGDDFITYADYMKMVYKKTRNNPNKDIVDMFISWSLPKAYYSRNNIGHYGLGMECYTHFTSPIRRYVDMMTHRLLENCLNHKKITSESVLKRIDSTLNKCNMNEIMTQHYEGIDLRHAKLKYISSNIKSFGVIDVVVTNIRYFGIFVSWMDLSIGGLIKFDTINHDEYTWSCNEYLSDDYIYAELMSSHKRIYVGDRIKVRIKYVDLEYDYLNFDLCD